MKKLIFTFSAFVFVISLQAQIGYNQSATTLENASYTGANHLASDPTSNGEPGSFPGDSYSGTVTDDGVTADFTVTHLTEQTGYQPSTGNLIFSSPGYGIGVNALADYTPPQSGTGNDVMAYKITLSDVPATHKPVIRLMQDYFGQNSEYSTYQVSWVGGETANAVYKDAPANSADDPAGLPPATTNGYYKFGSHTGFDLNNRQIEGTSHEGEITNGGTFNVYALYNNKAEWYVEFPVGVTEVSVIKTVSTGGVDATQDPGTKPASYYDDPANGIGKLYPAYGNEASYASANGESTKEFFAFKVDLIPNIILPVEFGNINVRSTERGVDVNWTTYSEVNNSHFEIERATDGAHFRAVGKVEGKGNASHKQSYSYHDITGTLTGTVYYRIKQVDFDGNSSYSEIRSLDLASDIQLNIYPNPSSDGILEITGMEVNSVEVYDITGRMLKTFATNKLDISAYENGVYLVVVNGLHTRKIIKR